ncbi:unnamed protein product, partial [Symbiodinium microadriaticum]
MCRLAIVTPAGCPLTSQVAQPCRRRAFRDLQKALWRFGDAGLRAPLAGDFQGDSDNDCIRLFCGDRLPPDIASEFVEETSALRLVGRLRRGGEAEAELELAFRGTDRIANWLTNFTTSLVPCEVGSQAGMVHQGFQKAYLSLRTVLLDKIRDCLKEHGLTQRASLLLRVTGHSLGGALAMLCAYDFAHNYGWEAWLLATTGLESNESKLKGVLTAEVRHVCTAVILDPTTSKSLHMMIAGMEVAALGREGQSGSVAEHVARPHFIPCYAEHLAAAIAAQAAAFEAQSENAWATLPSVGTWLNPLPWEASEVAENGGGKSESTAFDTREFLNYGSSLLSDFRGRGPRVLVDLHDKLGSYTKKQLEAMGVESNKIAKVPLETVLRSGPELLNTEAGQALLRQGQEQLLTMLPMLTLAAQKDGQSQASKQILMQMERNGVASKLLAWSRAKVRDAETDPELLRNCLASFNISNLADISSQIYSANAARLRKAKEQCIQLLYSEAAREKLRAAGIHVDDDEDVDLEQVLSQGQDLLKTE